MLLLLSVNIPLVAQTIPPLLIQSFPTGQRPMGVATVTAEVPFAVQSATIWAAVANSGENSVSLFPLSTFPPVTFVGQPSIVTGIPSPYGVVACLVGPPLNATELFVVTSPSANSVYVIDPAKGKVVGSVTVGSRPYAADCSGNKAYVSNYGDNTLSVVDLLSFAVIQTIPNVPGSRALHGVLSPLGSVWVAGTDANAVTILDKTTLAVITSIPIHGPTFVRVIPDSQTLIAVGSPSDNAIDIFLQSGLALAQTITSIPTPQDFLDQRFTHAAQPFGQFVSTGPGNSVAVINATGTTFIPSVPGAAGLAGGIWVGNSINPGFQQWYFELVTSPDSDRVFLIQPQPPAPSQFGLSNGASYTNIQLAAGSLASAFASTGVNQNFNATSVPLPKTLGGVTLNVGGSLSLDATAGKWNYSSTGAVQAPLLFVGPSQINFQIPPGIAPGSAVPAQLTKPDGTTLLSTLNITATAPGIFTVLQNGQGQAAVLNQDNSPNFGTNPAKRGSVIQIYATGGGETTPSLAPGEAAAVSGNPLVLTNAQPTVTIGGQQAVVQFSGMAPGFVGLWQINAQIPQTATPGNAVALVVSAGGVTSNTVTIAVQ